MEVNQFRKGNIVQFEKPVNVQLGDIIDLTERTISLSSYGIHLIDCDEKTKINLIPITEEWLKKFEFKKQNSIKHYLLYTVKTKHQQYFSVSEMLDGYEDPNELSLKEIKKYWSFDGNKYDAKIKYVHQLQNLYFALTGEELKLKLKN
jgi:hypothetical protein